MTASARIRRRFLVERIPVRFVAEGAESVGYLKNVSRAGLFIRSEDLPRPGCPLAVQFESPEGGLVNLLGEARWRTSDLMNPDVPPGFGVQIHEPPRPYRDFFLWAAEQAEKEPEGE